MITSRATLALSAIVVAAGIAHAGDSGAKCNVPIQECLNHMSTVLKQSGWVGIEYDPGPEGGYIKKVVPGSPAEKAGLQPGDILTALYGVRLSKDNEADLQKVRQGWKPGQSVTYTVRRQGQDRDVTLTLAPMPADVMAKWIGEHMMEHVAANNIAKK